MRTLTRVLAWVALPVLAGCGGSGGGGGPAPIPTYALAFDGTDDVAVFTFPVASSTTFTVEAWINPTTLVTNAGTMDGVVAVDSVHTLSLTADQTSFLYAVSVPGTNSAVSPTATLQAGVWQHLAGVFDGAQILIYRNGVLVGSLAHPGTAGGSVQVTLGLFSGFFEGLIDEVRMWNTARSPAEIQATMGSILTGTEAGLLAYWRFEEGAGQVLEDSTPNGRDGTLGADASVAADDPTRVTPGAPVS